MSDEWTSTFAGDIGDYYSTMTLGWWNWTGLDKNWRVRVNIIIVE